VLQELVTPSIIQKVVGVEPKMDVVIVERVGNTMKR